VAEALGPARRKRAVGGHYLAQAGWTKQETAPLRERGLEYDFYLANQMENPVLDADWRVYCPADR